MHKKTEAEKAANREYMRQQRAANPEKFKARAARCREKYRDKIRAASRRYYNDHREAIVARSRADKLALRIETFASYGGACVLCGVHKHEFLCIDHTQDDGGLDRLAGRGGFRLYKYLKKLGWPRNGYRVLCHNCNMARMLKAKMEVPQRPAQVKYTRKAKADMIDAYGSVCSCCGEGDPLLLALDHINGNGKADREVNGRGRVMYARLRAAGFPKEGLRLLCHNCNMSLGLFGYCPHQRIER